MLPAALVAQVSREKQGWRDLDALGSVFPASWAECLSVSLLCVLGPCRKCPHPKSSLEAHNRVPSLPILQMKRGLWGSFPNQRSTAASEQRTELASRSPDLWRPHLFSSVRLVLDNISRLLLSLAYCHCLMGRPHMQETEELSDPEWSYHTVRATLKFRAIFWNHTVFRPVDWYCSHLFLHYMCETPH